MSYSFAQLESIWDQASKGTKYNTSAWSALMAAIALAESAGNPNATNPTDNGGTQTSWGLWQISLGNHVPPAPNWNDPFENAKLAIGKLDSQGLSAWGTYDSGAYKQFMQGNVPPSNVAPGSGGTNATLTGFNPFKYILSPIPGLGQFGQLITGVTGTANTIGDVATAISGIATGISKITQLIILLMRPSFWLRIGAFVFGLLTMGAAFYFLKEAL